MASTARRLTRATRPLGGVPWLGLWLGLAGGCLQATAFECDGDAMCVRGGEEGRCEEQGVCSYLDSACDSGRSYSPNAGALAGECLPEQESSSTTTMAATSTSTSSSATSSTSSTSASTCGESDTDCPSCVALEVGPRSFVACAEPLTFSAADVACAAQGLSLASIHSDAENEALGAILPWPDAYWIGLNDRDLEEQWLWTDGSAFDYTAWGPDEPDDVDSVEDCVTITNPGPWSVRRCGLPNPYVCATPP